ncbi:hypothetical protein B0H11DRAFT_1214027 [Mycena galericulata]|nr:hypothetical protein B0H11DRAFT_1214027 [Mycena galericulata]
MIVKRSRSQKEDARKNLGLRPTASSNGPITPRRQHVLASANRKNAELEEQSSKLKKEGTTLLGRVDDLSNRRLHNTLNSVKGGVPTGYAAVLGIDWRPAPVKLMNTANDAAVSNNDKGSKAAEAALEASDSGAVKVTSLLGCCLITRRAREGRKTRSKLISRVPCLVPRHQYYQSHCDCAIFIILYLPHILSFMMHIMYSKTHIGLNHLESNILKGLKDVPTFAELVVLALYALLVSFARIHASGIAVLMLWISHLFTPRSLCSASLLL